MAIRIPKKRNLMERDDDIMDIDTRGTEEDDYKRQKVLEETEEYDPARNQ